jgi:hypothetical protein
MLRTRVVRQLLFEVAGLRRHVPSAHETADDDGRPPPASDEDLLADERHEIDNARRRALAVVVLDAVALAVLLLLRDPARGLLVLSRSEEVVFTVGVLIVAAHLGFRLAQLLVLRNLERAWEDLPRS